MCTKSENMAAVYLYPSSPVPNHVAAVCLYPSSCIPNHVAGVCLYPSSCIPNHLAAVSVPYSRAVSLTTWLVCVQGRVRVSLPWPTPPRSSLAPPTGSTSWIRQVSFHDITCLHPSRPSWLKPIFRALFSCMHLNFVCFCKLRSFFCIVFAGNGFFEAHMI